MRIGSWAALLFLGVADLASAQPPVAHEAEPEAPPRETTPEVATSASRGRAPIRVEQRLRGNPRRPVRSIASIEIVEPAPEPPAGYDRAVGRPNGGRLTMGVELRPSATIQVKPSTRSEHFATSALVGLLEEAAYRVQVRYPGAPLTVGDLSQQGGGRLPPHRSHQNGLDADVGFYLLDSEGRPAAIHRFVTIGPDLRGQGHGSDYRFDIDRNWILVQSLVTSSHAQAQYIFVADYIREALLEEGRRRGASDEVLERVAVTLQQPRRGSPHRNHFHVRIYCPNDDRPACEDEPPYHPWYE